MTQTEPDVVEPEAPAPEPEAPAPEPEDDETTEACAVCGRKGRPPHGHD